jgi:hypothetical protein
MPIMPQLVPNRIVIYPKDVQNITGKKERSARKLISDIRQELGKSKQEFITIYEFCHYTGLQKEQVEAFLIC